MRIPIIHGIIDRRILVNYRVDADVLAKILPEPFHVKSINGFGVAGICLIRLKQIRPWFVPGFLGLSSENAAHRFAVTWEKDGQQHEGVYIPRRDTSSRINTLLGGRLFPGVHHRARFRVHQRDHRYEVQMDSNDGQARIAVAGRTTQDFPKSSIFASLREASDFFQCGGLGYSPTSQNGTFDGLELRTDQWHVTPLAIENVESSFFDNLELFPPGTATFDCALLMQNIDHQWLGRESLCADCSHAQNTCAN